MHILYLNILNIFHTFFPADTFSPLQLGTEDVKYMSKIYVITQRNRITLNKVSLGGIGRILNVKHS